MSMDRIVQEVVLDDSQFQQATQRTETAFDRLNAAANTNVSAFSRLDAAATASGRASLSAARSYESLKASLDPAYKSALQLERGVQRVSAALRQGATTEADAMRSLDLLRRKYGDAASMSGRFGTAAQQAGFQIGDLATQIASGQSALVAITQQGTQFISMFGPWGAVIGAAGAAVGALAVNLWDVEDAASKAQKASEGMADALDASTGLIGDTTEELRDLAAAFRDADAAQRRFIEADFVSKMADNRAAIRNQISAIQALGDDALGDVYGTIGRADRGAGPRIVGRGGLSDSQAERFFEAVEAFDAAPTVAGMEALGQTVADITIELGGTSEAWTALSQDMLKGVRDAMAAGEMNEDLAATLDRLKGGAAGYVGQLNAQIEAEKEARKHTDALEEFPAEVLADPEVQQVFAEALA